MINQMSSEIESYCKESAKNLESNRKKRKKRKLFPLILHCIKKNRWRLSASHAVVNLKQMFLISRGMEFPEDLRAFSLIIFKSLSLHLFIFVKPVFSFKLVIKYKRLSSQIAQLSLFFSFPIHEIPLLHFLLLLILHIARQQLSLLLYVRPIKSPVCFHEYLRFLANSCYWNDYWACVSL